MTSSKLTFRRVYNVWGVLFCGMLAVVFGFQLVSSVYSHLRSNGWQPAKATVIAIENRPKSAELQYNYKFGGNEFTGDTFAFLSVGSIPDKIVINDRYRVGDRIEVYVNPSNPNQSVVERRTLQIRYLWKHLFIIGFSGFVAARCWQKSYQET